MFLFKGPRKYFTMFAWYGTSYFFLHNPQYLHMKKQKVALKPRSELETSHYLLAHRGGGYEAPENTM